MPRCLHYACLREAASAKAGHAGVSVSRDPQESQIPQYFVASAFIANFFAVNRE